MFSIGEFSKITGLPVKTLRFYHEKRLLVPSCVDRETGYRYYDAANAEKSATPSCWPGSRLAAMLTLADAGDPVGLLLSPVIPRESSRNADESSRVTCHSKRIVPDSG